MSISIRTNTISNFTYKFLYRIRYKLLNSPYLANICWLLQYYISLGISIRMNTIGNCTYIVRIPQRVFKPRPVSLLG